MAKKNALRSKPAFTAKTFLKGVDYFKRDTALDFLNFVKHKIDNNNNYDFTIIEQQITHKRIDTKTLAESLITEDGVVFVKDGKFVDEITYGELVSILEYGRKDKGVMPQSIIRPAFEEYRPMYKDRLKRFLKGKL